MEIAIIGSNGFIGRNLSYYLQKKNYAVYEFDIDENSSSDCILYERLDIMDLESVKKFFIRNWDYVFFMSGITGSLDSFSNYSNIINVNNIGLMNFLIEIPNHSNFKFIYPSTRLVYQGQSFEIKEDSDKKPLTPYAVSKLGAEQLIQCYNNLKKIDYSIFRIGVPFGNLINNDYSFGTIGSFLNQINLNNEIILFGDGSQKRTFTHIEDICIVFEQCIKGNIDINDIYNIGGNNLSLKEAAMILADQYDARLHFKDWEKDYLKIETWNTAFDFTKLNEQIGITYKKLKDHS